MPRGGYRPGAGRPKGSKNKPKQARTAASAQTTATGTATAEDVDPLSYLLKVMNDPSAEQTRRDRMAIAAAPLVHVKPTELGKKAKRTEDAKKLLEGGRFAPAQAPLVLTQPDKLN
jgi:phage terminase small subunit